MKARIKPKPLPTPAPREMRGLKPTDVQRRYGISAVTRWRWEKSGRIPPRDLFIGGEAYGWKESTLVAAESAKAGA
jgi:predicted DNA-binding transcriptional regulator AlpA